MRDGWSEGTIGDIAAINPERTSQWSAGRRIRYVDLSSVSAADGIDLDAAGDLAFGEAPGRARRVIRAGDVLVSTVRPYLRGFAQVPPILDGEVASTGFAVLRAREGVVLPDYLWCAVRTDVFVDGLMERATGSNYPAVRPEDVAAQHVIIPPLADQRRIVDLVNAFEVAAAASRREARALRLALRTMREEMLSSAEASVPLGETMRGIEAGRSPDGVDRQPLDGEAAVLKVSAVRPGWFDRTQVKVITDTSIFPAQALVRDGDLLITRANTRELVGAVCLVDNPYPNSFLCDKTLRLVPDTAIASAEYLHEVLQSNESRRQLSQAATGTSASMKNISQASIRGLVVPLLAKAQQTRLVTIASSLRDTTLRAERLADSLAKSRSAALTALLARDVALPESYDRFLDDAA